MIPASLTRSLVGACGRDGVIVDEDRLVVYESDALTAYRHRPGAVVLPRTTAQVRAVVRAIAQHGLPIVPRGAGTGLSGGAVALDGAVVVGTARMNRILEIDERLAVLLALIGDRPAVVEVLVREGVAAILDAEAPQVAGRSVPVRPHLRPQPRL